MTFNKCSIRGKLYGYVTDEAGNEIQDLEVRWWYNFNLNNRQKRAKDRKNNFQNYYVKLFSRN